MPIIAQASTTVRFKNFLIILLCAATLCWFTYDGMMGYPKKNDRVVEAMKNSPKVSADDKVMLEEWITRGGWNAASNDQRDAMYQLAKTNNWEGFHARLDIQVQMYIVIGLAVVTGVAVWWFVRCQKRRVRGDETGLSPAAGVLIPWEKIKQVDNTRWKSGYVMITYENASGVEEKALLDDYVVDRKALIEILQMLEKRAVNAEYLPKETAAG